VLPLVAILIASYWQPPALILLLILPLLAGAALLERRRHRYAVAGEKLFVMRGVWRQLYWIVPLRNVQAVSLSRSPLQRRLGLATLSVDTAGAPALQPVRIRDIRAEPASRLAEEISAYCSGRKSGTDR
jgi:putative membrane protein